MESDRTKIKKRKRTLKDKRYQMYLRTETD